MTKNTILTIIISLIIGGGVGYTLAKPQPNESNMKMSAMDHSEDHSGMNMNDGNMDAMMMDMMKRLDGKTGDELDKVFLEDMIVHHQGAVDMAEVLLAGTERDEMRKFANEIISVQTREIDMMQQWLSNWFPVNQ